MTNASLTVTHFELDGDGVPTPTMTRSISCAGRRRPQDNNPGDGTKDNFGNGTINGVDEVEQIQKDRRRRRSCETTKINFAVEAVLIEDLMVQLNSRYQLMEGAIRRIQSAMKLQMAIRRYGGRKRLLLLKMKRYLRDWIYCRFRIRERVRARKTICKGLWNYHVRERKIILYYKILAAKILLEQIFKYVERKRARLCLDRRRLSREIVYETLAMAYQVADERRAVSLQQREDVGRRLGRLVFPTYLRYRRRKMLRDGNKSRLVFFLLATRYTSLFKKVRNDEIRNETLDYVFVKLRQFQEESVQKVRRLKGAPAAVATGLVVRLKPFTGYPEDSLSALEIARKSKSLALPREMSSSAFRVRSFADCVDLIQELVSAAKDDPTLLDPIPMRAGDPKLAQILAGLNDRWSLRSMGTVPFPGERRNASVTDAGSGRPQPQPQAHPLLLISRTRQRMHSVGPRYRLSEGLGGGAQLLHEPPPGEDARAQAPVTASTSGNDEPDPSPPPPQLIDGVNATLSSLKRKIAIKQAVVSSLLSLSKEKEKEKGSRSSSGDSTLQANEGEQERSERVDQRPSLATRRVQPQPAFRNRSSSQSPPRSHHSQIALLEGMERADVVVTGDPDEPPTHSTRGRGRGDAAESETLDGRGRSDGDRGRDRTRVEASGLRRDRNSEGSSRRSDSSRSRSHPKSSGPPCGAVTATATADAGDRRSPSLSPSRQRWKQVPSSGYGQQQRSPSPPRTANKADPAGAYAQLGYAQVETMPISYAQAESDSDNSVVAENDIHEDKSEVGRYQIRGEEGEEKDEAAAEGGLYAVDEDEIRRWSSAEGEGEATAALILDPETVRPHRSLRSRPVGDDDDGYGSEVEFDGGAEVAGGEDGEGDGDDGQSEAPSLDVNALISSLSPRLTVHSPASLHARLDTLARPASETSRRSVSCDEPVVRDLSVLVAKKPVVYNFPAPPEAAELSETEDRPPSRQTGLRRLKPVSTRHVAFMKHA